MTIKDIKTSLRISHDLDDDLLKMYLETAIEYIKDSVDHKISQEKFEEFKQFNFAVSLLTQYWYSNRDVATKEQVPTEVTAMIQQLRGRLYETTSE